MTLQTKIIQRIWAYYFFLVFGVVLILFYPAFMVFLYDKRWHGHANTLRKYWASVLLLATGFSYRIEFEEALDPEVNYIFCPNHSSILDVALFALAGRNNYRFMAKKEFGEIPIFGIFFRTVDIAVNRQSKIGAYKAFKEGEKSLKEGKDLVIFPEGTTSHITPNMLDFKNGPFRLAIDTKVSIVPITFMDNWHLFHYDNDMYCKPGTARVIVHKPIPTAQLTEQDVNWLKGQTFSTIEESLNKEYGSRQTAS